MTQYRNIYRLEIIVGLSVIPKEVYADYVSMDDGVYKFMEDVPANIDMTLHRRLFNQDKVLSQYPVSKTIISEIIDNPNYLE